MVIFLIQTGTGLGTFQQGEMIDSLRSIKEDIFKTAYASYIVELLDRSTEERKRILIYLNYYIKL